MISPATVLPGAVVSILRNWVASVRAGATITMGRWSEEVEDETVFLHLLRADQQSVLRNGKTPPLILKLTYLVMVGGASEEAAVEVISDLAFSAMEHPELMLDPDQVSAGLWRALGIPPHASLLISIRTKREQLLPPTPIVRSGLETRGMPMLSFAGRIFAPGGRPLPGVDVTLQEGGRRYRSDVDGRFVIRGLTTMPDPKSLRLSKGGQALEFSSDLSPTDGGTIFTLKEPADHA